MSKYYEYYGLNEDALRYRLVQLERMDWMSGREKAERRLAITFQLAVLGKK